MTLLDTPYKPLQNYPRADTDNFNSSKMNEFPLENLCQFNLSSRMLVLEHSTVYRFAYIIICIFKRTVHMPDHVAQDNDY